MFNWALRYQPIVDLLRGRSDGTVLEVGSGDHGLAAYHERSVIGVDLSFTGQGLRNLTRVAASAVALPFPDAAFTTVVSSDMLEHVPERLREEALGEMVRVTGRWLILGFPAGPTARDHDTKLAAFLSRHNIPEPDWLREHLAEQPPTAEVVMAAVADRATLLSRRSNSNATVHRLVLAAELTPKVWRLVRRWDSLTLARVISPVINRRPYYREVLLFEKGGPGRG